MQDYIKRIKEALKDPSIEGVEYVNGRDISVINSFLRANPQYKYISEWHDNLFGSRYFVKVHDKDTGEYLKKILEEGKLINKPNLISVKSIDDLDVIKKAA